MDAFERSPSGIDETPGFFWPSVGRPGMVPLSALVPTPNQPRTYFDPEELKALAETMKGGKQREILTVRALTANECLTYQPARYLIKSGERRWRAAHLAKLPGIEIRVKEYETEAEEELDAFMLNENRVGLSDIENAREVAKLTKLHGWETQVQIANGVGKDQVWVSQHLALLKLSPKAQARMEPSLPEGERFTRQVGVFLARFIPEEQDALVKSLPKDCTTASRQITWMTAELKRKGIEVETRRRTPSHVRDRVNNLCAHALLTVTGLLEAQDFDRLFEGASPMHRRKILDTLRDAHTMFGHLVARVEQIAHVPASTLVTRKTPEPVVKKVETGSGTHSASPTPTSSPPRQSLPEKPSIASRESEAVMKRAAAQFVAGQVVRTPPIQRQAPATLAAPRPAVRTAAPVRETAPKPTPRAVGAVVYRPPPPPLALEPPETLSPEESRMRQWARGITVDVLDSQGMRYTLKVVTPKQYISYFDKRELKFQIDKKEKPAHLPTREQAVETASRRSR